tara:strand:+ start:2049 stop:2279 length:231 start_codon:yes stop_codon:yes gene_type:complete
MLEPKKRKSVLKAMSKGNDTNPVNNDAILKQIDELNTKGLQMLDDQENGVKGATELKANAFFDQALKLEQELKKNK